MDVAATCRGVQVLARNVKFMIAKTKGLLFSFQGKSVDPGDCRVFKVTGGSSNQQLHFEGCSWTCQRCWKQHSTTTTDSWAGSVLHCILGVRVTRTKEASSKWTLDNKDNSRPSIDMFV
jgi:hypothetical protein